METISTGSVRMVVPSEKRAVRVTGLARAERPSVKVVVPATGLVRAVAPLSQRIMPVDRLVRQVCAPAPPAEASRMEARKAESILTFIKPF